MTVVLPGEGTATSNLVSGEGTNTAVFTIGAMQVLDVESVVATIDASGAGDTTAKLVVRDPSGQVIATKQQGDTIPSGDTGTATFALRLDDNGGAIRFNRLNVGGWLSVEATGSTPATGDGMLFTAPSGFTFNGDYFTVNAPQDVAVIYGNTYGIFDDGLQFRFFIRDSGGHWGGGIHSFVDTNFPFFVWRRDSISDPAPVPRFKIDNDGNTTIWLNAGGAVIVRDRNNDPIFEIDETGDLRGKTGKALTFNL